MSSSILSLSPLIFSTRLLVPPFADRTSLFCHHLHLYFHLLFLSFAFLFTSLHLLSLVRFCSALMNR
eukprot:m.177270 g.177270  ORF g.177270 m.177270 type:complete len:67 (+) comp16570_c11_seq1:226-426(+)